MPNGNAETRKESGNKLFLKGKFQAAVDEYTEAICFCPDVPTYYTNRALCYLKMSNWDKVQCDSRIALSLDPNSIKANYFLGVSSLKYGNNDEAIQHLTTALKFAQKSNASLSEEIHRELLRAKKKIWTEKNAEMIEKRRRLHQRTKELMKIAKDKSIAELTTSSPDHKEQIDSICLEHSDLNAQIDEIFISLEEVQAIPLHLCCPVSMDIMLDPVITPSGTSYERSWIERHLQSNGWTDPITRERLTPSMLRPNLSLREAVLGFIEKNPWAFEESL